MTSCEPDANASEELSQCAAERIVTEILARLDGERLSREIDDPIDRVLEDFRVNEDEPYSTRLFHQAIADFMRELYRRASPAARDMSREDALAEAIAQLERGYRGRNAVGYDAARHDAAGAEPNNVRFVIEQLAALVKASRRQRRLGRVFATVVGPSDWRAQCQVAEYVRASLAGALPDNPLHCAPAQLAPCWRELVLLRVDLESQLQHFAATTLFSAS